MLALTAAGSIKLGFHMGRGEVHITGGGVDVGVAQQCLHHRQIDTRFGERCAEGVAQCVRVSTGHTGDAAVVSEDLPQPRRRQRLTACRSFGNDEQPVTSRVGPLGEEVGLDHTGDIDIEWHPPFLVALAQNLQPAATDIDIAHIQREDLS